MFNLRRNIVLAIGLIALLSGAILATLWLRQLAASKGPAGTPKVFVLAAAKNLASGTLMHHDDMTWISIDQAAQRRNYIVQGAASMEDYEGALVRRDIRADEPFGSEGLMKSSDRNFLSAALTPGFRALTLPIEAQQSSSGLVLPGDRVDIILTQNLGDAAPDPGHRVVAQTLLYNVRVVAVEQALTPAPKTEQTAPPIGSRALAEARVPKTITLEVSEQQAQKLLVAMQLGKVDLVERALVMNAVPGTVRVSNTWAYDVSPALTGGRAATSASPSAPFPSTTRRTIEVMHGSKLETR